MKITQAEQDHIEAIIKLNAEVQSVHCDLFPDVFKETNHKELRGLFSKWIADKNFRAYVVVEDGLCLGYIFCRIVNRDEHEFSKARKLIYVDQVCVTQEKRRKGIGKSLIGKVIELAKMMKINRIELDYWIKNKQAGRAFESFGFSAFNQKMEMTIE